MSTPASKSNKPSDTAFLQQRLSAWSPSFSPCCVITCFFVLGAAFVGIGAAVVIASDNVVEVAIRYDQETCLWKDRLPMLNYSCMPFLLNFTLTQTMRAPIVMYYELNNFYQNHRRFAKSKNDGQLVGEDVATALLTDCAPILNPGQLRPLQPNFTTIVNFDNNTIDVRNIVYDPCGLVPWSMFNDSFVLSKRDPLGGPSTLICNTANFDAEGNVLDATNAGYCTKKGIAWSADVAVKYAASPAPNPNALSWRGWPNSTDSSEGAGSPAPTASGTPGPSVVNGSNVSTSAAASTTTSTTTTTTSAAPGSTSAPVAGGYAKYTRRGWYLGEEGHQIPDPQDEDLMVWARVAGLPNFRKRLRLINNYDLTPGNYQVVVLQRFDTTSFNGQKRFVVASTSWVGGKNYIMGFLYIAVGGLKVLLAIAFGVKEALRPKRIAMQ